MRPLCLAVLLLFSGTQESDSLYIMSIVLNIMISPDDGGGSLSLNKTISDGGLTVDFSIIKVHTSY